MVIGLIPTVPERINLTGPGPGPTGWCFAIGAAGPPPDRWEYDSPEPPGRFHPRVADEAITPIETGRLATSQSPKAPAADVGEEI